jgi:large subunit ribosomal protein L22
MEAIAKRSYLRVSPSKVRLVIDQIRGHDVDSAMKILNFSEKRVAGEVRDVLKSAIANAENNYGMDVDTLVVSRATVDQGSVMKRIQPRARGRSFRILKRTSHITVGLTAKG